jgi:signal transduction histidine kinase
MKRAILVFLFLGQLIAYAQDSSFLIDDLRNYRLDDAQIKASDFEGLAKSMIYWQVDFLKNFDISTKEFEKINHNNYILEGPSLGIFLYYLSKGDYYFYKYHNKNIEANEFYLKALLLAKKEGNIQFECEAIKRILNLNRQTYLKDNITTETYLARYKHIAYDDLEKSYYQYHNLILSFQYSKLENWKVESSRFLLNFIDKSDHSYLITLILQLHAIHQNILGQNKKAVEYEERAIAELGKIQYNYKSVLLKNSKLALARYYFFDGNPKKASFYLSSIDSNPNNRIEEANYRYYYYYKSLVDSINGDFLSAYGNLMKYNEENNHFTILKNQNAFNELEVKYQTAEKEKQILIEIQEKEKNRNVALTLGGLLLGGGLIFFLVQKNTTKKRLLAEKETQLKQERVDNLLKEQELVTIDAIITGQEKERKRVANELHDDLGSLMATIKLHFDNVKGKNNDPSLQHAQTLLEEAYQKVRGMAHSKNSGVMSNQGLLPAIKKMAQVISETNALEVTVEDFGMGERLENSLELSLFRTVQELVANAIKHAEATKLNIQLTQHEDNLNIIVEDNGIGFDRNTLVKTKTGMGLTNIEKRIEHLEGNFTVDSILGKGTSILIDIPV